MKELRHYKLGDPIALLLNYKCIEGRVTSANHQLTNVRTIDLGVRSNSDDPKLVYYDYDRNYDLEARIESSVKVTYLKDDGTLDYIHLSTEEGTIQLPFAPTREALKNLIFPEIVKEG